MGMRQDLIPLADRGPLRVMFCITSMPVGGAETLLVNLIRRLDRERFAPELCCLKELGPLGEIMAVEVPAFDRLLSHKCDLRILPRLTQLFRERRIDAVVTVGAGDKMFWGRLAAWRAGVPVVASALHSTGWPDGVGRLNRLLTPITDAFIGVAQSHGRHLVANEGFPRHKVRVIPNGVDVDRFRPRPEWESDVEPSRQAAGSLESCEVFSQRRTSSLNLAGRSVAARLRESLGVPRTAPLAGIVAALRPEKNHELFLRSARLVRSQVPEAHFLIVGDGPERGKIERLAVELELSGSVHFLGSRPDVQDILALVDVFALTSHIEANPVSILEAMASGKPVVATRVGSVPESVHDGVTGYLAEPGDAQAIADRVTGLLQAPEQARQMGQAGRALVEQNWSLDQMVRGYEDLICEIYSRKAESR